MSVSPILPKNDCTCSDVCACNAAKIDMYDLRVYRDDLHVIKEESTIAALDSTFEKVHLIQSSIRRFVALIESPSFTIRHKLEAGEALIFDNRRMLHGREAFQPETGDRHFQGCYLDTAEVLSRRNALARCNQYAELI